MSRRFGTGNAGALQEWVIAYVALRFPDGGIEYWSRNDMLSGGALQPQSLLPERINAAGCYVTAGHSEGRWLNVVLGVRGGGTHLLLRAKSFGSGDECWAMARAVSEVLEQAVVFGEQPDNAPPLPVDPAAFAGWLGRIEHALQLEEDADPSAWHAFFMRGLTPHQAIEADRRAAGITDAAP